MTTEPALQLLPGTPALRRDDHHLQVGLEPDRSAVVRDEPDVRRVLAALRAGEAAEPTTIAGHDALRRLAAAGLLRDPVAERAAAGRLARLRVALDVPADLEPTVTSVLGSLGVRVAAPDDDPTVALVMREGPVPREDLDASARDGLPHLLVSSGPESVTVGPFVAPGHTACLRCLDAHRADIDPRWPVVVAQAAAAPAPLRSPLLLPLGLRWAAGDLRAWGEDRVVSTWSATVRVDEDLEVRRTFWTRHPACGCAWGEALVG